MVTSKVESQLEAIQEAVEFVDAAQDKVMQVIRVMDMADVAREMKEIMLSIGKASEQLEDLGMYVEDSAEQQEVV